MVRPPRIESVPAAPAHSKKATKTRAWRRLWLPVIAVLALASCSSPHFVQLHAQHVGPLTAITVPTLPTTVKAPPATLPARSFAAANTALCDGLAQELFLYRTRLNSNLPACWAWQTSLPKNRLVLFYGDPDSPVLGPIGRYSDQELVARLRQQAATYQSLDPAHPVVPGLDYISPVAQPTPQKDRTYTRRMPDQSIQHYVELARANHLLFFFDLQIGHSTVEKEVDALWPYVNLPWVNIALDPEFDMAPGNIPGVEFGRMYAWEVNSVIHRLSQLVAARHLPPKILIVHWFRSDLLPDWSKIKLEPGVSLITSDDGVGSPGPKIDDYNIFDRDQLIQYPGIKIFYNLDKPLMSEEQVVGLRPSPVMVMYQ